MSIVQRGLRWLTGRGRAPNHRGPANEESRPHRGSRLRRALQPIITDPDRPARQYDAFGLPPVDHGAGSADPDRSDLRLPESRSDSGTTRDHGPAPWASDPGRQDQGSGVPDSSEPGAPRALGRITGSTRPVYTGFMLTVGVGLALLIFYIGQTNSQLLVWIGAALFIALGLDPVVRALERVGLPRWSGVLITMLTFLSLVSALVAWLAPAVTQQMSSFVLSTPQIVYDISESAWFQRLDEDLQIQDLIDDEVSRFVADPANITNALGGLFGVGAAVLTTGFGMLVVAVLALYFLASLPTIKAWGYRLVPGSRRERIRHLGDRILNGVGYYVIGQACVAFLNGVVAYIAISIAGVPFGALFAVVVGVLAFIPLVGPVTGGTLVTLVALTVDWQTALTFVVIYFIYLQVEAYFVSPRIMSRAVRIPAAVAVISVIAGGTLLGVLGALMAIPTAAALMLLVREVIITHQDSR